MTHHSVSMQVFGCGNKEWLQAVFSDHGGKTGLHPWEWWVIVSDADKTSGPQSKRGRGTRPWHVIKTSGVYLQDMCHIPHLRCDVPALSSNFLQIKLQRPLSFSLKKTKDFTLSVFITFTHILFSKTQHIKHRCLVILVITSSPEITFATIC